MGMISCGIKTVPKETRKGQISTGMGGLTTTLKGNIPEVQLKWPKIWTLSCLMSNIKMNQTGMTQERMRMILLYSRNLRPWCKISHSTVGGRTE